MVPDCTLRFKGGGEIGAFGSGLRLFDFDELDIALKRTRARLELLKNEARMSTRISS